MSSTHSTESSLPQSFSVINDDYNNTLDNFLGQRSRRGADRSCSQDRGPSIGIGGCYECKEDKFSPDSGCYRVFESLEKRSLGINSFGQGSSHADSLSPSSRRELQKLREKCENEAALSDTKNEQITWKKVRGSIESDSDDLSSNLSDEETINTTIEDVFSESEEDYSVSPSRSLSSRASRMVFTTASLSNRLPSSNNSVLVERDTTTTHLECNGRCVSSRARSISPFAELPDIISSEASVGAALGLCPLPIETKSVGDFSVSKPCANVIPFHSDDISPSLGIQSCQSTRLPLNLHSFLLPLCLSITAVLMGFYLASSPVAPVPLPSTSGAYPISRWEKLCDWVFCVGYNPSDPYPHSFTFEVTLSDIVSKRSGKSLGRSQQIHFDDLVTAIEEPVSEELPSTAEDISDSIARVDRYLGAAEYPVDLDRSYEKVPNQMNSGDVSVRTGMDEQASKRCETIFSRLIVRKADGDVEKSFSSIKECNSFRL